jgi:MFS family permease
LTARSELLPRLALGVAGFAGIVDTAFLMGLVAAYATELGANPVLAGLVAGFYSIVALFASPVAGLLVDRLGRMLCLRLGLAWDTATVFAYSVVENPYQLLLVRGLHALGGSLVYPAYIAAVGDVAIRRKGFQLSIYLSIVASAIVVGALTAGMLVERYGFRTSIRILSLIILIGFLASLLAREPVVVRRRGAVARLREAVATAWRGLLATLLLYASFGFIVGGLAPAILEAGLVASEEEAGATVAFLIGLATLVSIPAMVGSGLAADRGLVGVVAIVFGALPALNMVRLVWSASKHDLIIAFTVYGLAVGFYMLTSTLIVVSAPVHARGTAAGLQQVVNILGVAVGASASGYIVEGYGLPGVVVAAATPLLAAVPVIAWRWRWLGE